VIISLDNGGTVDTDTELSPVERHVLQKLLCYREFVSSVDEYRHKKAAAYTTGWNDSGPIEESAVMTRISDQLEREITTRLKG
jgi:hypothetical protein